MPMVVAASALFATWFGSETIMGASSEFVENGMIGVVEDPFGAALCLILVGLFFARKQENTEMFFLAGRRLPWLAVAMSMYASLTSAVTYLGLPATAYAENISLIMVCIMSPLVAPFILLLFYPLYHFPFSHFYLVSIRIPIIITR